MLPALKFNNLKLNNMSKNMIKVVITQLGEQKLVKIVDAINDDKVNEFIPVCGKSFLLTEKTGESLIAKKYGKKCAMPKKVATPK